MAFRWLKARSAGHPTSMEWEVFHLEESLFERAHQVLGVLVAVGHAATGSAPGDADEENLSQNSPPFDRLAKPAWRNYRR